MYDLYPDISLSSILRSGAVKSGDEEYLFIPLLVVLSIYRTIIHHIFRL